MRRETLCLVILMVFLAGALGHAASPQFMKDCAALTKNPHRLAGSVEYKEAADYVEQRLGELEPDQLFTQEFPAAQTQVKRCEIEIKSATESLKTLPLHPMRPNGILPPVSPKEGLSGRLLYGNVSEASDFSSTPVKGSIVVLDYNSNQAFLRAFRLGARAVIFVRNGDTYSWNPHNIFANVNLPRFYYDGPRENLPEGTFATIHSEVVWETVEGKNILAFFKGTNPVFNQEKEEILIVATNLDSFGEVPTMARGARSAANCAGLLKLAEVIKNDRPRRSILFAFFDNQARGHAGSCAFYRAIEDDPKEIKLDNRKKYHENEIKFLAQLQTLLSQENPLKQTSPARREFLNRLKRMSANHSYEYGDQLFDLRKQMMSQDKDSPLYQETKATIDEEQKKRDVWNELRRALTKDMVSSERSEELNLCVDEVRKDVAVRASELELQARNLEGDQKLCDLLSKSWIGLHVSLLFGDTSPRWGLIIGGDSCYRSGDDVPGLYGKIQASFLSAYKALEGTPKATRLFEVGSADGALDPPRLLWAAPLLVHSGEVAGKMGIYNLAVGTAQENLQREGTPDDTLDRLNVDRIEAQVGDFGKLLVQTGSEEGLSLRRSIKATKYYTLVRFESDNRPNGPTVMGRSFGNAMPDKPMPDVTIQFIQGYLWGTNPSFLPKKFYAFDNYSVSRSDHNGSYYYGPAHPVFWFHVGFGAKFDDRGELTEVSDRASVGGFATRINMIPVKSGYMMLPPLMDSTWASAFRAKGNSMLDAAKSYCDTIDGVFYWHADNKIDAMKVFGLNTIVALNNGGKTLHPDPIAEADQNILPEGLGFSMKTTWMPPETGRQSASDLWRLNESRLNILRSRDIINNSLEELHGNAEDLLLESEETDSTSRSEALAASSFLCQKPVYADSKSTLDDLIKAVLILLGLCIPFAYALERLLIGATTVYKQIAGFAAFFIVTFLILYFTHPAFAVSKTPMIIFLGFAVVLLSSLVIFIIMRKFEVELKVLQGLTSTVHAADVSRFSTVMAAMSMGISTMRRRPLRTALTATTIILLTFTILCFASFGTRLGIIKFFLDASPRYSAVFAHDVNWKELNQSLLDVIRGRWEDQATVCPRFWMCPEKEKERQDKKGPLISLEDGTKPLAVKGLLGLDAEEIKQRPDFTAVFGNDLSNWSNTVHLTRAVANAVGLKEGDTALVGGMRLKVGRLLEGSQLAALADMDRSGILPVDFVVMQSAIPQDPKTERQALTRQVEQNWAHLAPDSVVIVSCENARAMGAVFRAVSLYVKDARAAGMLAEHVAKMLELSISATREDGVYRHTLGTIVEASGAKDLFFPIVLGGLVIFGTMLGSVADREREIYTFSSLGLAPPHVASLFLAEALVYSVLGGMGGYLIAQAMMRFLTFLAGYGLVQVPEMNYSSLNAIVTILLVMGTVLISAIYPALKASRSANPGILRTWRLPLPKGDVFDITFPFTVSNYDITGVVSFLKEHFDNFSDTGLGVFMAQDARLVRSDLGTLGLDALIALAPFDLGVTQTFEMRSVPSEIPGIDEVKINLTRKSGQPKDWQRLNKVLLDELRRQFLIWRSLPEETMEIYRHRTLSEMGQQVEC